ncbi:ABC transporter permease [Streptomyces sp. NPDC093105]|uniref:ABC transporter permease n=1 Tax=Streptomyces sp. NPDC093105 TaxID=3366029 RepID=UPI00382E180A
MTTATATAPAPARAVTVRTALNSEWIKVRSARSSFGSLVAVLVVGLATNLALYASVGGPEPDGRGDPVFRALFHTVYAQIAAVAFGATAVSSEYLNGALRNSLAAVPRRGLLYAAKAAVVGGTALAVGLVTSFAAFFAGQAFAGEYAIGIGAPGALRGCLGAGAYLALMALLGFGLTFLLRSAVGSLSILVPALLVLPFLVGDVWPRAAQYLPDRAAGQLLHQTPAGDLGPWTGLGVAALWVAAALAAGWWSLRRRDV